MKVLGIILIVLGILMFVFRGFNFTTEEKVADIGPLEINKEKEHSVGWPLYAGGILVAAGAGVLIFSKKK